MKNLTNFSNIGEYNNEVGEEILSQPNVSLIEDSGKVLFSNTLPPFEEQYLTFIPLQDGQFKFIPNKYNSGASISYSVDYGTTWNVLPFNTYTPTIVSGHKVYWKGEGFGVKNSVFSINYNEDNGGIGYFASTCDFDAEGNPVSLYYGDDLNKEIYYEGYKKWIKNNKRCPSYGLYGLFVHCNIVNAKNLALMSGTDSNFDKVETGVYQFMFSWCNKLVSAPTLPSLKTRDYCYQSMFNSCSSLVTAPTIASLNANDKPKQYSYNNMFKSCYSLKENIPASLPYMWDKDDDNDSKYCYGAMFSGCKALESAPTLPSLHIPTGGYSGMFTSCNKVDYIKAMFVTPITNSSNNKYTTNWVNGVAASGTFVKNSAATWNVTGVHGVPNGWTVQTASA